MGIPSFASAVKDYSFKPVSINAFDLCVRPEVFDRAGFDEEFSICAS